MSNLIVGKGSCLCGAVNISTKTMSNKVGASHCTIKLTLMVEDVDAIVDRACDAGAIVVMPPCDQFYGHRSATVRDPFGHEWMFQREIEKVVPEEMQRRWNVMVENSQATA